MYSLHMSHKKDARLIWVKGDISFKSSFLHEIFPV